MEPVKLSAPEPPLTFSNSLIRSVPSPLDVLSCRLTVTAALLASKLNVSIPPPPARVSLPAPPPMMSLPVEPVIESLPVPPIRPSKLEKVSVPKLVRVTVPCQLVPRFKVMTSLVPLRSRTSIPSPPSNTSLPAPPLNMSLPWPPIKVSLPAAPRKLS